MKSFIVKINGKPFQCEIEALPSPPPKPEKKPDRGVLAAPFEGTVQRVDVTAGGAVKKGESVLVLEGEAMRSELLSPLDGTVGPVVVAAGTPVKQGDILLRIK